MAEMPSLISLQSKDNPFCQKIKQVRRRLINACPTLGYFDDRPVGEIDRACAEAWQEGGLEAERNVR